MLEGLPAPTSSFVADQSELERALKLAFVFKGGSHAQVQFTLIPGKGEVLLDSQQQETGSSTQPVEADITCEEEFVFKVNTRMLVDALGHFPGEKIRFDMSSPVKPIKVKVMDGDGDAFALEAIVMPLR